MVSVLAASAERQGERVKGRNGVAEGGWWARSRPTVPHDSADARAGTTASTEGLGPACLPDAERSANGVTAIGDQRRGIYVRPLAVMACKSDDTGGSTKKYMGYARKLGST